MGGFTLGSTPDKLSLKNAHVIIHRALKGFLLLTSRFRFFFNVFGFK